MKSNNYMSAKSKITISYLKELLQNADLAPEKEKAIFSLMEDIKNYESTKFDMITITD